MVKPLTSFSIKMIPLIMFGFSQASWASNTVVVCTDQHCPGIEQVLGSQEKMDDKVVVYQTSYPQEFMVRRTQSFSNQTNGGWHHIQLKQSTFKHPQPIIGFGGAFSDSATMLYKNLSPLLQTKLMEAYFSQKGIAYTLGRVPIGSTDFSCRDKNNKPTLGQCSYQLSPYFYIDKLEGPFLLQEEDIDYKIPMIQRALQIAKNENQSLVLFASPWSAPAFMKSNGHVIHGSLLPQYYSRWATYYIQFLKAYREHQILFWGLTVQNEPVEDAWSGQNEFQQWQTMYFSKELEAHFVKKYLGPALKSYEVSTGERVHLIVHDDQLKSIASRMTMMEDPAVAAYVSGAGLHWYMNSDGSLNKLDTTYQLLNPHDDSQQRFILATEACTGYLPYDKGPRLGNWSRGEQYAHDILSDLNHYVTGWTDWNLMLDMQGGPNWAGNLVDAPILVDVKAQVFYKQPMYYYLGHFSKFIRPGSHLLNSQSEGWFPLEEVSFKVPAYGNLPETIVIVVLNRDMTGRKYYIADQSIKGENKYINLDIPAHAIQTIIYQASQNR